VKFLLATTDPQKLPATVLSRCLQFNLKNMPPEQIVTHLSRVLEEEAVAFEEPALWLLGRAASGSMRDALSLTDQAIAFGSGSVREDDVRSMLGSVDISFIYQLLEALAGAEPSQVLAVVAQMSQHTADYAASLDDFLSLLHRVVTAQLVPEAVDPAWGDAERIRELAARLTAEDAQFFYQLGLQGKRDLELVADPREGFEMVMLRMVAFRPAAVIDASLRAEHLQAQPVDSAPVSEGGASGKKCRDSSPVAPRVDHAAQAPPVLPDRLAGLSRATWPDVLEQLGLGGIVYNIASHCQVSSNVDGQVRLTLDENNAGLFNPGHTDKIRQALEQFYSCSIGLVVEPGEPAGETPAMRRQRQHAERQQAAVVAIEADPQVQALLSRFDGELDLASIAPTDS
ncbi:MAG: DNA polymerase III subunit gamma/tau, partial [Halioglobus sp.]|nr:DNA polymerase III subunit gamma/tau [Halioglobus sp.]